MSIKPAATATADDAACGSGNTRERLLDSAECLIARHGFSAASVRRITEHAGANLSAVSYYFGSKQALTHEVLRRRLDRLNRARLEALSEARRRPTGERLAPILRAMIEPALVLSRHPGLGGNRFVRVLARAYAEDDRQLHSFLHQHYAHVMRSFAAAIREVLPELDDADLRSHLDFIIGALTYSMADFAGHFTSTEPAGDEQTADRLVDFAVAGLESAARGQRHQSAAAINPKLKRYSQP